jgi:hypothetical protein
MDLYLKFASQEEAIEALTAAGLMVGEELNLPLYTSIDEIGLIGDLPDWHVNVRTSLIEEEQLDALEPFLITPPETPHRIWA